MLPAECYKVSIKPTFLTAYCFQRKLKLFGNKAEHLLLRESKISVQYIEVLSVNNNYLFLLDVYFCKFLFGNFHYSVTVIGCGFHHVHLFAESVISVFRICEYTPIRVNHFFALQPFSPAPVQTQILL